MIKVTRVLALLVFGYLLFGYVVKHQDEFRFLSGVSWQGLIPIAILTLLVMLIAAFRFWLVIRRIKPDASYMTSLKHICISRFLNNIMPQSGFIYKIQALTRGENIRTTQALKSLFVFIWLDILLSLVVATMLIGALRPALAVGDIKLLPFLLFATAGAVLITVFVRQLANIMQKFNSHDLLGRVKDQLDKISGVFALLHEPRLLSAGIGLITFSIAVSIWRLEFCFELFGMVYTPDIAVLALFVALQRLSGIVVITPGNFGVLELAYGLLSEAMGIGMAEGVMVSLTVRIMTFVTLACLSAYSLLHSRLTTWMATN